MMRVGASDSVTVFAQQVSSELLLATVHGKPRESVDCGCTALLDCPCEQERRPRGVGPPTWLTDPPHLVISSTPGSLWTATMEEVGRLSIDVALRGSPSTPASTLPIAFPFISRPCQPTRPSIPGAPSSACRLVVGFTLWPLRCLSRPSPDLWRHAPPRRCRSPPSLSRPPPVLVAGVRSVERCGWHRCRYHRL